MTDKKWGLVVVLLLLALIAGPLAGRLFAQDDLGKRYQAPDHSFVFKYPADWTVTPGANGIVTLAGDQVQIDVYGPGAMIEAGLDGTYYARGGVLSILVAKDTSLQPSELVDLEIDGREAAQMAFSTEDESGLLIAIAFGDGTYGLLKVMGDIAANETTIMAIAATFDGIAVMAGEPDPTATPAFAAPTPASGAPARPTGGIGHLNGTWQERIQELEELGLIGSGGSLIFQEDYAYFAGQGAFFTPLAMQQPHSNVVLAGQLTYTSSGVTEKNRVELCSLGLRVTYAGQTATHYVDVGLIDPGYVFYDQYNSDAASFDQYEYGLGEPTLDLGKPHDFLILALGDLMTVFVDGERVFEDVEINEIEGSYAVGLTGLGPNALCEATNVWAYQVPVVARGVCQISTASAVNKRSGPGTDYDSPGQLLPGVVIHATGQTVTPDNFRWWQLDDESWVRSDIVHAEGDCMNLPEVAP